MGEQDSCRAISPLENDLICKNREGAEFILGRDLKNPTRLFEDISQANKFQTFPTDWLVTTLLKGNGKLDVVIIDKNLKIEDDIGEIKVGCPKPPEQLPYPLPNLEVPPVFNSQANNFAPDVELNRSPEPLPYPPPNLQVPQVFNSPGIDFGAQYRSSNFGANVQLNAGRESLVQRLATDLLQSNNRDAERVLKQMEREEPYTQSEIQSANNLANSEAKQRGLTAGSPEIVVQTGPNHFEILRQYPQPSPQTRYVVAPQYPYSQTNNPYYPPPVPYAPPTYSSVPAGNTYLGNAYLYESVPAPPVPSYGSLSIGNNGLYASIGTPTFNLSLGQYHRRPWHLF